MLKPAKYYETLHRDQLQCNLCPHHCTIGNGKTGICRVRKNEEGDLYISTYGQVSSAGFDPIEKKPLYHFYPGSMIFSIGGFGCNLRCQFCQNYQISQSVPVNFDFREKYAPEDLVKIAKEKKGNAGIAFTYNEPTVWFEFMMDIAELSKKAALKNVVVTNGFINPGPLAELLEVADAFNVDLKAFTEDFYRTQTMSKLAPVKESLKQIRRSGRHLEITNLVIPGLNDDRSTFEEMVKWISGELGKETVLHLSRYFPTYKSSAPPTSSEDLNELFELAREYLDYVYLGNVQTSNGQNTYCPSCGHKAIDRSRYDTWISGLDTEGNCKKCGFRILENI